MHWESWSICQHTASIWDREVQSSVLKGKTFRDCEWPQPLFIAWNVYKAHQEFDWRKFSTKLASEPYLQADAACYSVSDGLAELGLHLIDMNNAFRLSALFFCPRFVIKYKGSFIIDHDGRRGCLRVAVVIISIVRLFSRARRFSIFKAPPGFPSQFIKSTKVLLATPQRRRLGYHTP